jgi:hypothetical protein
MSLDHFGELNWLAVAVAAVAYFALGGLWFARPVFGRAWAAAAGVEMPEGRTPAYFYWGPFVAVAVSTVATGLLACATQSDTFAEAVLLGLVLAVGFAAAISALSGLFDQRPRRGAWFAIFTGYHAVGLMIASIIVSLWR